METEATLSSPVIEALPKDSESITPKREIALTRSKSLPYGGSKQAPREAEADRAKTGTAVNSSSGIRNAPAVKPKYIRTVPVGLPAPSPRSSLPASFSSLPDMATIAFPQSSGTETHNSQPLYRNAPTVVRRLTASTSSRGLAEQEQGRLRQARMAEVEALGRKRRESGRSRENRVAGNGAEKAEPPGLDSLPTNPTTWSSSQLAVYLSHVLKLIPAPLISDIHTYVLASGLDGAQFLKLRESDLRALGINRRWARVMNEARVGLRRECLRGRLFGFSQEGLDDVGELQEDGSAKPTSEPRWKNSWRAISTKMKKGHVRGVAKRFEDGDASPSRGPSRPSGRVAQGSSQSTSSPSSTRTGHSFFPNHSRGRGSSISSIGSEISFSESESILSTDEIDFGLIPLVAETTPNDDHDQRGRGPPPCPDAIEGQEKTIAELLCEVEEAAELPRPSHPSIHVSEQGIDPKYVNVTRRSARSTRKTQTPSLEFFKLPDLRSMVDPASQGRSAASLGAPSEPAEEGKTVRVSKVQPESLRITTSSPSSNPNASTESLDQLFERAGNILGIIGTASPSSMCSSLDPAASSGVQSKGGSVAIVKKSRLREMEARMKEIERRLEEMGELPPCDSREIPRHEKLQTGRGAGGSEDWLPTGWTDLGGYVVMASLGVGIVVGQVVVSKVFGIRR